MNKINLNYEPLSSTVTYTDIRELKSRFSKNINPNMVWLYALPTIYFGYTFVNIVYAIAFSISGRMGSIFTSLLLVLSVFISLRLYTISQNKLWSRYVRLDRFASVNGMKFIPDTRYPAHTGMIFNIGTESRAREQLIGITDRHIEVANYSCKVGSGKNKHIVDYGYIMVQLDRKLPHIVLDSHKNNRKLFGISVSNLPITFNKGQKLALEGDFNSFFDLYVPKGYERDALYVFTPDLMQDFISQSGSYDAEIIDDRLYIYSDAKFDLGDSNKLKEIFNIIDKVGSKTLSRTSRYTNEAVQLGSANSAINKGYRLKRSFPWVFIIFTIVLIVAGMVLK